MDMSRRTADAMQPDSFCRPDSCRDLGVDLLFKYWIQEWHAQFRVPVEMQEDLVVHMA